MCGLQLVIIGSGIMERLGEYVPQLLEELMSPLGCGGTRVLITHSLFSPLNVL